MRIKLFSRTIYPMHLDFRRDLRCRLSSTGDCKPVKFVLFFSFFLSRWRPCSLLFTQWQLQRPCDCRLEQLIGYLYILRCLLRFFVLVQYFLQFLLSTIAEPVYTSRRVLFIKPVGKNVCDLEPRTFIIFDSCRATLSVMPSVVSLTLPCDLLGNRSSTWSLCAFRRGIQNSMESESLLL